MDKNIGRLIYRIKGSVSAKNYLAATDLNIYGPVLIIQMSIVDLNISTIHMELLTKSNIPLRITFSTLYDQPKFLGRSLRLDKGSIVQMNEYLR